MKGLVRGRAAIAGVAESDLGAVAEGMSPIDLMAQGVYRALDDAGLKIGDVDGLFAATSQVRLSAPQRAAVEAARSWSAAPTEEHRRGAQSAAEALGGKTPAGWLALAAFWSEGSIGPPDAPEIPVVPGLSARAVGMAVTTVAGWRAPETAATEAMRAFLQTGRQMLEAGEEAV